MCRKKDKKKNAEPIRRYPVANRPKVKQLPPMIIMVSSKMNNRDDDDDDDFEDDF